MADDYTPQRPQPPARKGNEFEGISGGDDIRHRGPGYGGGGNKGGGGGDSNPVVGWLIFILIFGVGNFILYSTTGIVIIPFRR
jgi:hypothetical protein